MGEIVLMRDYEPRQRAAPETDRPPAQVFILPIIRIESDGWLRQERRREIEEA